MSQEDILKMTRNQQISYWVGRLCLAIGNGSFNSEVHTMMDFYQREAYERGRAEGKKEMSDMF